MVDKYHTKNPEKINQAGFMISNFPNFIYQSVLSGTLLSMVLAWGLFHRGLLRMNIGKSKRIAATLSVGAVLAGWLLLAILLARQGFFEAISSKTVQFPNIVYTFLPLLAGLSLLFLSKPFRQLIDALPQHWLIGIQFYRVLGIFFLVLYTRELLPAEFAIPAGVGDVLVGITAPIVGYLHFAGKSYARWLAILWNLLGIADLVLAVILGFLTSPGPFQMLAFDLPNELITRYPLVMVPAFGVPLSVLLHIFALRKLIP